MNDLLTMTDMNIADLCEYLGVCLIDASDLNIPEARIKRFSANPTDMAWITTEKEIAFNPMAGNEIQVAEAILHEIAHMIVGLDDVDDKDELEIGVVAVEYALTYALDKIDEKVREAIRATYTEAHLSHPEWAKGVLTAYHDGWIENEGFPSNKICFGMLKNNG